MPPTPVAPWTGSFDATRAQAAAPQPVRMPDDIRGSDPFEMDENCLSLSVWTPSVTPTSPTAVLVWIHGGGFTVGSAGWSRYDATAITRNGDIVIVCINYRLGYLGFLHAPALFPDYYPRGNLNLLDQILALRWVRDHIAAFGGDPHQVTVAGQSGGAGSIAALMASPEAAGLFRQAILQSGALAPAQSTEAAATLAEEFLDELESPIRGPEDLQALSVDEILATQDRLLKRPRPLGDYYPPYQFVADGDLFRTPWVDTIARGWASTVDILAGTTKDDGKVAFARFPDSGSVKLRQVVERFRPLVGDSAEDIVSLYQAVRATERPSELMGTILADCWSKIPALRIAEGASIRDSRSYVYEFEWESRDRGVGACHGIDVPFVFNNFSAWRAASMLNDADPSELRLIGSVVQDYWTGFIRAGDPNDGHNHPAWRSHDLERRPTMRLGQIVDCVDDYSGGTRAALGAALPALWP
jgi:para-nitrobenzyl esterase